MTKTADEIKFQEFNDGLCDFYTLDNDDQKTIKYTGVRFSHRVLGYNRVFAAKAVQEKINAVIRIPKINGIDIHDTCEIKNVGKFDIVLTQNINDTNPSSIDLTLRNLEMFNTEHHAAAEEDT